MEIRLSQTCVFDIGLQIVTRDGIAIRLPYTEFCILERLAQSPNQAVPMADIIQYMAARKTYIDPGSFYVYILRLRRRMEENSRAPRLLMTVGRGRYMLCDHDDEG
ncbi:MAG: winged helix-turn-helix domain-containing protein [Bacilli bacterium]